MEWSPGTAILFRKLKQHLAILAAQLTGFGYKATILYTFHERKEYEFSLLVVYLVWIAIVLLLYPLCKWYDKYKNANKEKWWLSCL